jgi:flagellar biosynthesis protein FlhF
MEIHTYRAASLQEALMLVRHELGPEASVLQTREVAGKFFGLLGKGCIEVQASRDAKVIRRLPESVAAINSFAASDAAASGFDFTEDESQVERSSAALHFDDDGDSMVAERALPVAAAVASSRSALASARRRGSASPIETSDRRANSYGSQASGSGAPSGAPVNYLSPAMFEVFTEMLDADVDPDAARTMLQEVSAHCTPEHLNDAWLIKGRLCQLIQQQVNVSGPIELDGAHQQVVALIGPTGVGKTTTLAKLAAGFHFDQGTSVGFITLDTFRLGAVDQLQKYADLLGAPCEVVSSPDQMRPALERLNHCQLILIDTAGRSPRDHSQLAALNDFLQVATPTQIHLVLSAASSQSHAAMALEQFAELHPTHLLLTKLDESPCLGGWYRLLSSGTWPLSYITTGQHVPEDILVANRRRVASLILGQTNHLTWK